jgi:hypothetical protein
VGHRARVAGAMGNNGAPQVASERRPEGDRHERVPAVSSSRRDQLRAADIDRKYVADLLKRALDEGRLDLGEYDERLQRTYAARTYGDLDKLLTDLPKPPRNAHLVPSTSSSPAMQSSFASSDSKSGGEWSWLRQAWRAWFIAVGINVVIWLIITITTTDFIYPWPLWVAGPWGVVLLGLTLFGNQTNRSAD